MSNDYLHNFEILEVVKITEFQNTSDSTYLNYHILEVVKITEFQNFDPELASINEILEVVKITEFQNPICGFCLYSGGYFYYNKIYFAYYLVF